MQGTPAESTSRASQAVIDRAYDEDLLRCMDILERNDFYGVAADLTMEFFGEKLTLTAESRLLELGSGIGGPARFLARTYGCRVLGVDLSAFNDRTARERTKDAGLEGLVAFVHGDALAVPLAHAAFTHVFCCEALCYFPDKREVFSRARRLLRPNGRLAFLEAACEAPVRLRTEDLIGPVQYESKARYTSMLEDAGFDRVEQHDTTGVAAKDVARSLYHLITRRDQLIAAAGEETYYGLLEIWAEFLANFSEGNLTHCGFVARSG
jgi:SAM-dependent methyltransferase